LRLDRLPRSSAYDPAWIVEILVRKFGAEVWATDLWIGATENAGHILASGLEERVLPIRADARSLPFAHEFFDAIVSVDALEYFGTDDLFLPSLIEHLKPGRQVGVVNAGLGREVETLAEEWPPDFSAFHTLEWWSRHWSITRCGEIKTADHLPEGRKLWLRWNRAIGEANDAYLMSPAGENLGFHRVVARRKA
jgi:cyclopropane fatty-acyl-phospholipid synthase-like methyltransferase